MYLKHFGLHAPPFETTSNGRIRVDLPSHREAFNTVLFGLRSGEGFVKVVGEVGTGKTVLCRTLLATLDREVVTAYLPDPPRRGTDLLRSIVEELSGPRPEPMTDHDLKQRLRQRLLEVARAGRRVVVLVDEAQTMPAATLEELRLLSNLETARGKLVQVVLFGQPELDAKLDWYALRQLQQRISFSARLEPLDREDCRFYVDERLMRCGGDPRGIVARSAIDRIHRESGGLPRLVNVLAHKSLIAAYADGARRVAPRHVARAARDTEGIRRWQRRPLRSGSALRTADARRADPSHDWRPFPI